MVITGRESKATERRMSELKVDHIFQNVKDKVQFLRSFMQQNNITAADCGYIGDDLNDLSPMKLCSFIGCPADAATEVKEIANYVKQMALISICANIIIAPLMASFIEL